MDKAASSQRSKWLSPVDMVNSGRPDRRLRKDDCSLPDSAASDLPTTFYRYIKENYRKPCILLAPHVTFRKI